MVRFFGRRGTDEKYAEHVEKAGTAGKQPDNKQKVRIRLFDAYGNKETVNVRVKTEDDFLRKTRDKIANHFGVVKK